MGVAFVTFKSKKVAEPYMNDTYFNQKLSALQLESTLSVGPAELPSNLIWSNLGSHWLLNSIKRFFILFTILTLSFLLLTPTYALQILTTLFKDNYSSFSGFVLNYLPPLIVVWINFSLIPMMIQFGAQYEGHQTKSGLNSSVINKTFGFMMLNTLLLPVTETSSAISLAQNLQKIDIFSWPRYLSSNLMN